MSVPRGSAAASTAGSHVPGRHRPAAAGHARATASSAATRRPAVTGSPAAAESPEVTGSPGHGAAPKVGGASASAGRRKRSPGWVPNQHGAWAMLIAPYLVGLVITVAAGRFRLASLVLFAVWITGYFAFYATSLWLKSRRKARYLPPVPTYVLLTTALGLITLGLDVSVWSWLLPFGPVLVLGLLFAYRRDDRSIASGLTTVAAACLMPAVVYTDGFFDFIDGLGTPAYGLVAIICAVCFGYFFGTVLYVKTMIRERGHIGYVAASAVWHAGCTAGSVLLALVGGAAPSWLGWALAGFFTAMTVRALVMPMMWPMRGKVLRAGALGIGELVATFLLVGILIGAAV